MSFAEDRRSEGAVDVQLRNFIETEIKQQEFQSLVHNLTDICWDTCIDRPSARLEGKVEKCLSNCVERFIDATSYMTNRLERIVLNKHGELDLE